MNPPTCDDELVLLACVEMDKLEVSGSIFEWHHPLQARNSCFFFLFFFFSVFMRGKTDNVFLAAI